MRKKNVNIINENTIKKDKPLFRKWRGSKPKPVEMYHIPTPKNNRYDFNPDIENYEVD